MCYVGFYKLILEENIMKSLVAFTFIVFFASTSLAQDQTQQTLDNQGWIKQNYSAPQNLYSFQ